MSNLTEKQKQFCLYYVKGYIPDDITSSGNATQSAIKAGYSVKTAYSIGSENLKKPDIMEYIRHLREEVEKEFYYSRIMSMARFEKAQKLALEKVETKIDKNGEVIETPAPDLTSYIRAEELKGKLQGLYVDKQVLSTDIKVVNINHEAVEVDRN